LNPVRAKVVNSPEEYDWSGHFNYLGKGWRDLVDEEAVLSQFCENRSAARRKYRQFVWDGISGGHDRRYYQVKDQQYLGESEFIDRIENERKQPETWIYDISLKVISEEVSRAIEIKPSRLHSATQNREGAKGRSLVAYLAKEIGGYTIKEVADYFRRSPGTISEAVVKVHDDVAEDRSLKETLEVIRKELIKGRKRKFHISDA
jgi:putative transposase